MYTHYWTCEIVKWRKRLTADTKYRKVNPDSRLHASLGTGTRFVDRLAIEQPVKHQIKKTSSSHCGGGVRIIACIEDPVLISQILSHVEAKQACNRQQAGDLPPSRAPPAYGMGYLGCYLIYRQQRARFCVPTLL